MRDAPGDLRIRLDGYAVRRAGHPSAREARYTVWRPDGSELCREVVWPDVERAVDRDRAFGRDGAGGGGDGSGDRAGG